MTGKHYGPAPIAHDPKLCDEPPDGMEYPPAAVLSRYPNLRAHTCITSETRARGHLVVIEPADTEPHLYVASSRYGCEDGIRAARPLCVTCNGTHPEPGVLEAQPRTGVLLIPGAGL